MAESAGPEQGWPVAGAVWEPWPIAEVQRRFGSVSAPWYIAGGWAVDLFLGGQTRSHHDLEVGVPSVRFEEFAAVLDDHDVFVVRGGRRWPCHSDTLAGSHQTWVRDRQTGRYRLDVFREPSQPDTWVFRRDPRLQLPYEQVIRDSPDGVPYLAPALTPLFKAKAPRPQDQQDFHLVVRAMNAAEKEELAGVLDLIHPGHPWLTELR